MEKYKVKGKRRNLIIILLIISVIVFLVLNEHYDHTVEKFLDFFF